MNPFLIQPDKSENARKDNWNNICVKPCVKEETAPYTRVRMILMNGTEFETVQFLHRFSRMCTNNELRRELSLLRRNAQIRQKRLAALKPENENLLEHTIGYEQLAVDLTAILAKREKNTYVKKQFDFALLEDFDHLYRYADLMELEKQGDPAKLVGDYTEIMPGRPTIAEQRHPYDDVKFYINHYLSDLNTRLNVNIITAAEQQTMNYYMNVGNFYATPLGRRMFTEIAMIEEQHVTGYGGLKDPSATWLENLVMNAYTSCFLYESCRNDETDERIAEIYTRHLSDCIADLAKCALLLEKYEGKVWQQLFPEGGDLPELIAFRSQKDYVRNVLKTVRLTAVEEGFEELALVPDDFRYFAYNKRIAGNPDSVATHIAVRETIRTYGKDYRLEDKPHPVTELASRTEDNISVGREKSA